MVTILLHAAATWSFTVTAETELRPSELSAQVPTTQAKWESLLAVNSEEKGELEGIELSEAFPSVKP